MSPTATSLPASSTATCPPIRYVVPPVALTTWAYMLSCGTCSVAGLMRSTVIASPPLPVGTEPRIGRLVPPAQPSRQPRAFCSAAALHLRVWLPTEPHHLAEPNEPIG